jgi:serine/threonine protein kinase
MQTVAQYNLLERIGESRLGELYRARDTRVGRTVAVRLVAPAIVADPAVRQRFLEDAAAAAALSHPNIATLFDAGEQDGQIYLAHEFTPGLTLGREMGGRPAGLRRSVEIAVQIADALADGHARDVLHGDLRPDTIIVTPKGSIKLLDFGMSAWTRGGDVRARAAAGDDSLGNDALTIASYLSPEQALGGTVDTRSDIFACGLVLFEMLTGKNPFVSRTVRATVVNIIQAAVPVASTVNSEIPPELDAMVSHALAKDIEARPQSAASLSAELRSLAAVLDVRSGDSTPGPLIPIDDETGGSKWWIVLVGIILLGVAVYWLTRR